MICVTVQFELTDFFSFDMHFILPKKNKIKHTTYNNNNTY